MKWHRSQTQLIGEIQPERVLQVPPAANFAKEDFTVTMATRSNKLKDTPVQTSSKEGESMIDVMVKLQLVGTEVKSRSILFSRSRI